MSSTSHQETPQNTCPFRPEVGSKFIQKMVEKLKPARTLPLGVRYGLTIMIVFICFALRASLQEYVFYSPYLLFIPAVILSSLLFDRGSGILAVFLSGFLAFYFFIEPTHSFFAKSISGVMALGLYILIGLFTALVLEALRDSVEELAKTVDRLHESRTQYKTSEERLRLIINGSLDAIASVDEEGSVTEWNKQAENIFGWSHAEAIGKSLARIILPPDYRTAHEKEIQQFLKGKMTSALNRRIELIVLNKNSMEFPIELSVTAQELGDGHHYTIFMRDITDRKKNEEAQAFLASLVKHSEDGIVSKSLKGKILSWNKGAENIFGYTAAEAVGQHISLIIPPEKMAEEEKIIFNITKGIPIEHLETVRVTKSGRHIDIAATISPIYDSGGHIVGASKIVRDITSQKEANAKLNHYMGELEEVNERLQESNKQLDDFAYIVSHDLKEPIRGIDSYCAFLLEDYRDKLDTQGQEMLGKIKNMSLRINELVSDLLNYSRAGRENTGLEEVDLDTIVKSVLELMRSQTEKEDVVITVAHPLPKVYCSKAHVAEIFRNLIVNGIKYNTSHPKKIDVGFIQGHERNPQGQVFFVKDNGIGIPPEHRETVFRMFKRLHARDQYGGGTGAGLAIVKKLVEQHDGEIWVEPNEGGGSIFYFYVGCA
jgi:two-component system sensor kinase FixL